MNPVKFSTRPKSKGTDGSVCCHLTTHNDQAIIVSQHRGKIGATKPSLSIALFASSRIIMFKKAVIFLSLVAAAEAGRKNIKDSQRKNAVPEEILKAERALRKGGKSKNGGKSKGGGKSSQEEDKVDGETFCGIVSLAVSDIATSTTRLQCGNLSPELLAAMCPSQDDLCSADFSLADFCPEDCEQQCRE